MAIRAAQLNARVALVEPTHHIGGVILLRANDNFSAQDNLLGQTYDLNRLFQDAASLLELLQGYG